MLYSTRSVQCSFFLFNLFSRWRHRCVKRKNTCSACCVRNVAGGESLRPKLANSGELAATPAHPHPAVLLDHLPLFRKTGKQVTASDIMWQLMIFGWHHKASGIRGLLYVTSMASDELIWWEMTKKKQHCCYKTFGAFWTSFISTVNKIFLRAKKHLLGESSSACSY